MPVPSDEGHRHGKPMDKQLTYDPSAWRRKLALIAAAFVVTLAVLYSVQANVVLRSFEALEHSHAQRDLERAANAVHQETSHLERVAADWASWDDTYEFMVDGNRDYAESNLVPGTFEALDINLIVLVDVEGNVVRRMAYDLEAAEEVTIPEYAAGQPESGAPLLTGPADGDSVAGIHAAEWGPMLVASQPILTSDDEHMLGHHGYLGVPFRRLDKEGGEALLKRAREQSLERLAESEMSDEEKQKAVNAVLEKVPESVVGFQRGAPGSAYIFLKRGQAPIPVQVIPQAPHGPWGGHDVFEHHGADAH